MTLTSPRIAYGTIEVPSGYFASAAPALRPGDVLGSTYRVTHVRERLSSGALFEADDMVLGREVIIKISWRGTDGKTLVEEARRLAKAGELAAAIYGVGIHQGRHFVAAELIQGVPLPEVLATGTRGEALTALVLVAEAVAQAGAHRIRIGGVTPGSIVVVRGRRVVFESLALGQLGEAHVSGIADGELRQLGRLVRDTVVARCDGMPAALTQLLAEVERGGCDADTFAIALAHHAVALAP
ncbi:MAG: hypothetical protein R3B06_15635 [Kofleriaceae bacterium]